MKYCGGGFISVQWHTDLLSLGCTCLDRMNLFVHVCHLHCNFTIFYRSGVRAVSDSDSVNIFIYLFISVHPVLKPLVEVLSDPDSINRMLLSQLEQREQQAEQQKKAYTYAASYEDFIKLISTSTDVNFLKQLRHDSNSTHPHTV